MKHFRLAACLCCTLLLSALLGGCVGVNFNSARYGGDRVHISGSGARTQLEYTVDSYDEITVRANVELIYSAEPSQTVKVDIYENMVEFLNLYVENGSLVIDSDAEFALGEKNRDTVKVYISNPDLKGISVRGAVMITEADPIRAEQFSLSVGGACQLELYVDELDLSLSGAGEVELSGEAKRSRMSISGVGQVDAEDLVTEDLEVSISGTGEAAVHCTETLDVSIAGMGVLKYRGNPRITQKISGMGTITSIDSSILG